MYSNTWRFPKIISLVPKWILINVSLKSQDLQEQRIKSISIRFKCFESNVTYSHAANSASKGSLFNHVKIVHEKARPFKCPICGRDFAAKQQMQQHVSSIHEGNRPFACEICHDVRFRGKQGLTEHMASVHEGQSDIFLGFLLG